MSIFKRDNGNWTARFRINKQRYQRTFATKEQATEWEAGVRECEGQPDDQLAIELAAPKGNNLSALLKICLDLDWADKSHSQRQKAVVAVRIGGFETLASDMTMQWLDLMVVKLKRDGLCGATIKNYLHIYSVMQKRALRLGWIDQLPLQPEKRTLPSSEPRSLVLDDSWVSALLTQLESDHLKLLTRFLHLTGCRIDEALSLSWSRCSFERRRIQFIKTKTLNARALPMSDELRDILVKCQRMSQRQPFPFLYRDFYTPYKKAVDKTCLQLHLDATVQHEWVIHTLRHTCLTQLAVRGATAIQIMEWAGHKSLSTSQKYVHQSSVNLESLAGFSSCLNDDSAQPSRPFNPVKPIGTTGVSAFDQRCVNTLDLLDSTQ